MSRILFFIIAFTTAALLTPQLSAQEIAIDYLNRYKCQPGIPDHIMNAIEVPELPEGRAIVSTNKGLTLINLAGLPQGGSSTYLDRLEGINARDLYSGGNGIYYINIHRRSPGTSAGFAVIRLVGNDLQPVTTIDETETLFEKMCVADGYLYVAAHAHGLRIYSLADPLAPVLIGSLADGFIDAYAVAVDIDVAGNTAYIADGAGGLKVVDVSNPAAPFLLDGETLSTAIGTAEDITISNGNVYAALGGAGLAVYSSGDPSQRVVVPFDGCAESLCWVEDHLAVGTLAGVLIFDVETNPPQIVGGEVSARRGNTAELRICSGVNFASGNRLLASNWDYMDVYHLTEFASGNQPDITPSHQRIRFAPDGGTEDVTLFNNGTQPLNISNVSTTSDAFDCNYTGGVINPAESVEFQISYDGSGTNVTGLVLFESNDPDENPLPVQVFGETTYLDPNEPAIDFTLPLLTYDIGTGLFNEEPFTLSDHHGKVIWFQVFGTW